LIGLIILKTVRLFVSYRSTDSNKVDAIVSLLRNAPPSYWQLTYQPWQDKRDLVSGHDWWEGILNAIESCDVFVFMVSRESADNINCRAEVKFAQELNRPILPVVLSGEYSFDRIRRKNDLHYWTALPPELRNNRVQMLFYEEMSFIEQFNRAVTGFLNEPEKWQRYYVSRPSHPDPNDTSDANTIYKQAVDFANRREYTQAVQWFQRLHNLAAKRYGDEASAWIEMIRRYKELLTLAKNPNTSPRFRRDWFEYASGFPKPFLPEDVFIFDPERINPNPDRVSQPSSNYGTRQTYPPNANSNTHKTVYDDGNYGNIPTGDTKPPQWNNTSGNGFRNRPYRPKTADNTPLWRTPSSSQATSYSAPTVKQPAKTESQLPQFMQLNRMHFIIAGAVVILFLLMVVTNVGTTPTHYDRVATLISDVDQKTITLASYWNDIETTRESVGCEADFELKAYNLTTIELERLDIYLQSAIHHYNETVDSLTSSWRSFLSACRANTANDAVGYIQIGKPDLTTATFTLSNAKLSLASSSP